MEGNITRANRDGTFDADIIDSNGNNAEIEDIVRNCIGDQRCQGAIRKQHIKATGKPKFGKQRMKQAYVTEPLCLFTRSVTKCTDGASRRNYATFAVHSKRLATTLKDGAGKSNPIGFILRKQTLNHSMEKGRAICI